MIGSMTDDTRTLLVDDTGMGVARPGAQAPGLFSFRAL
jgi:hypothetical protein